MIKFIFRSLIFVCLFWMAFGFDVPSYEWYITDTVGIFSETEKADLNAKIEEIEKTTSIEIAVLVVPMVDDDINLAAVDVGNTRWVGKEGQNNWVVLLIAIDDRKRSIQVGYGLEWTLPDLVTKRIGEARFPSNFREGNYYQGVVEMLADVQWYIVQDPTLVETYNQSWSDDFQDDDMASVVFFIIIFMVISFGRRITVPKANGTKRKMKKYGRWIYAGVWLVFSLFISWMISSIIAAAVISYLFLLFSVLMALWWYGSGAWKNGIRFGWSSGSSWGWWWGFGGFWWGGFGGGWSSGGR